MNSDYVIHIATKHGRTWRYLKEDNEWTQTGPTGRVHQLSAEQLLSHLLPPLAGDQPSLSVTVERKKGRKGKMNPSKKETALHRFRRFTQITESKPEEKSA